MDFEDYEFLILKKTIGDLEELLEKSIKSLFDINEIEQSLIDYSTEIALPILKRSEETGYGKKNIFQMLSITDENDRLYLNNYAYVFIDHFKHRFNSSERFFFVNIHIAEDFIGFHFIVDRKPESTERVFFKSANDNDLINEIGSLGIHSVTRDLYIQQDVRGFNKNTFYIIKPNEFKCWHQAVAHHDLIEFIDALTRAETLNIKTIQA
jgi:hypothetical protein